MSLPVPEPGLVISYSYLWKHQDRTGLEEGLKNRPCAIMVVVQKNETDQEVWVVPVTHTPPANENLVVEIPPKVKKHLGLDEDRSWAVCDEVNRFIWPGPDLRPVPGIGNVFDYGFLPPRLFNQIRDKMVELYETRQLKSVERTE